MMGQFEQLDQMLTEQEGMLRTSQVVSSGISKPVFYDYVRSRYSRVDAMYLLHLRFEQAVFSHETALFFHDLTDREPIEYTVTVKTGCNPSKMKAEGIQVFTIKADLHDVGLTTAKTPFGHTVPVYDMERTICDLLRSRSRIEIQTFQGALKAYARRKDKNLRALMQYAGMFKVEKILRQYLEVLL